jgi:hypothetical protein
MFGVAFLGFSSLFSAGLCSLFVFVHCLSFFCDLGVLSVAGVRIVRSAVGLMQKTEVRKKVSECGNFPEPSGNLTV